MSKDNKVFGFYDVYLYMHMHRFKYADNIGSFVVDQLLKLEEK